MRACFSSLPLFTILSTFGFLLRTLGALCSSSEEDTLCSFFRIGSEDSESEDCSYPWVRDVVSTRDSCERCHDGFRIGLFLSPRRLLVRYNRGWPLGVSLLDKTCCCSKSNVSYTVPMSLPKPTASNEFSPTRSTLVRKAWEKFANTTPFGSFLQRTSTMSEVVK